MSRAVSHPFDLCLSKNDLKFFLQEKDIKNYSFLQVRETIHEIIKTIFFKAYVFRGFPGGTVDKNLPANAGDMGLISRLGRSSGEYNDYPLQYSWLQNLMDRGA